MQIENQNDFNKLRDHFFIWRKRFPMFAHDVRRIQNACEYHISEYGKLLVLYRQSRNKSYLEKAQKQIDSINKIINTVEKLELMAILSKG